MLGTRSCCGPPSNAASDAFHVSTDEVHGSIDGVWTEESPWRPNSPYAASRPPRTCWSALSIGPSGWIHLITAAPTTTGPTSSREGHSAVRDEPHGRQERSVVRRRTQRAGLAARLDDHCAGIALALQKAAAGGLQHRGGTELTNLALTHRLRPRWAPASPRWRRFPIAVSRPPVLLDISKIHEELGYSPQIDLGPRPGHDTIGGTHERPRGGSR